MPDPLPADPVLLRFSDAVRALYGRRLDRIVLYGSRARGEARPDSDYDIAVFIREAGSFAEEAGKLAELGTDLLMDTGAVVSATPFPAAAWRARTGFMHELRRDGRSL